MNWLVSTIKIKAIKASIFCDPLGDFEHVFVLYDKVGGDAPSAANWVALFIALMASVLV